MKIYLGLVNNVQFISKYQFSTLSSKQNTTFPMEHQTRQDLFSISAISHNTDRKIEAVALVKTKIHSISVYSFK